jgi:hypothetical protein
VVNKIPKRARSYRQHKRRRADGWRKRHETEEWWAQRREDLGGAGWRPDPTQKVNPQAITGKVTNDAERTEPPI